MKKDMTTDTAIRVALRQMTDTVHPPAACKEGIRLAVARSERKERQMKTFGIKKLAVAAAVCVFFVGTMAIAGGGVKVVSRVGTSSPFDRYTSYEDLHRLTEKAGIHPLTVQSFSNGFTFDEMHLSTTTDLDEDDNVVNRYYDINIDYVRDGSPYIFLTMQPKFQHEIEEISGHAERIVDDVKLVYSVDEYLGLPAGEAPTEEELQRAEEDPHFYISDGFEERREYLLSGVVFIKDDILYNFGSFDSDLSAEEFLDMGEELLANGVLAD